MESLVGFLSEGWLLVLALLSNIQLRWKRLTVTNALAYYGTELIKAGGRFIVWAPGANVFKPFLCNSRQR